MNESTVLHYCTNPANACRPNSLYVMDLEMGDPAKLAVFLGFPASFGALWGKENVNNAFHPGGAVDNSDIINAKNGINTRDTTNGGDSSNGACSGLFGGAGVCITAPKAFRTVRNSAIATASACCDLCAAVERCTYWVFKSEPGQHSTLYLYNRHA